MKAEITKAGHHPRAFLMLAGALAPYVDDPAPVAAEVFAALHDAGLRIVSTEALPRDGQGGAK